MEQQDSRVREKAEINGTEGRSFADGWEDREGFDIRRAEDLETADRDDGLWSRAAWGDATFGDTDWDAADWDEEGPELQGGRSFYLDVRWLLDDCPESARETLSVLVPFTEEQHQQLCAALSRLKEGVPELAGPVASAEACQRLAVTGQSASLPQS